MRLIDADALKADHIVSLTTSNSLCHLYVKDHTAKDRIGIVQME